MADSSITKAALSAALKGLMDEYNFEKISVGDICKCCNMSRKSFYYHFKDKYELVNWIFDTEFITVIQRKSYEAGWDFLADLCEYLYANQKFYRAALQIQGQNAFSEHFRDMIRPTVADRLRQIRPTVEMNQFQIDFLTDGSVFSIIRWIQSYPCSPPEAFLNQVKQVTQVLAVKVYDDMKHEESE